MAGETILVVDDGAHIVELAQMYLEQEGFYVAHPRKRLAGDTVEIETVVGVGYKLVG